MRTKEVISAIDKDRVSGIEIERVIELIWDSSEEGEYPEEVLGACWKKEVGRMIREEEREEIMREYGSEMRECKRNAERILKRKAISWAEESKSGGKLWGDVLSNMGMRGERIRVEEIRRTWGERKMGEVGTSSGIVLTIPVREEKKALVEPKKEEESKKQGLEEPKKKEKKGKKKAKSK